MTIKFTVDFLDTFLATLVLFSVGLGLWQVILLAFPILKELPLAEYMTASILLTLSIRLSQAYKSSLGQIPLLAALLLGGRYMWWDGKYMTVVELCFFTCVAVCGSIMGQLIWPKIKPRPRPEKFQVVNIGL